MSFGPNVITIDGVPSPFGLLRSVIARSEVTRQLFLIRHCESHGVARGNLWFLRCNRPAHCHCEGPERAPWQSPDSEVQASPLCHCEDAERPKQSPVVVSQSYGNSRSTEKERLLRQGFALPRNDTFYLPCLKFYIKDISL